MAEPPREPPFFSVIMPVYNHAAYVADAVRSVQAQTYPRWELIVVDDGSTDGSADIVDSLAASDGRITAVHQANAGPAAARNKALTLARGEWLAYIDSDDLWFEKALQHYADAIAANPEASFFHGYRHRLNADGSITELAGEFQDRVTGTAELFGRMFLSHLCVCYRRTLIDRAGPYDDRLRSCEDYELYLRMSLLCRFVPLGLPTGLRRRHASNLSRRTGHSRMLEAEVLRRFAEGAGAAALAPGRVKRRLASLYRSAAKQYFKTRRFREAAHAAGCARRIRPTLSCMGLSLLARCLAPLGRSDDRPMPKL